MVQNLKSKIMDLFWILLILKTKNKQKQSLQSNFPFFFLVILRSTNQTNLLSFALNFLKTYWLVKSPNYLFNKLQFINRPYLIFSPSTTKMMLTCHLQVMVTLYLWDLIFLIFFLFLSQLLSHPAFALIFSFQSNLDWFLSFSLTTFSLSNFS